MGEIAVTAADQGRTIEARIGDTVVVMLAENPTTGYQWQLEAGGPGVRLVSETFDMDEPPSFGSGGIKHLVFEAIGEGPSRIRLRHWQPFSGERSIDDHFEVVLDVQR